MLKKNVSFLCSFSFFLFTFLSLSLDFGLGVSAFRTAIFTATTFTRFRLFHLFFPIHFLSSHSLTNIFQKDPKDPDFHPFSSTKKNKKPPAGLSLLPPSLCSTYTVGKKAYRFTQDSFLFCCTGYSAVLLQSFPASYGKVFFTTSTFARYSSWNY